MLKTRKISSAEQFALHLTCIVLKSDDCKMQYIKAITLFLLHGKLFSHGCQDKWLPSHPAKSHLILRPLYYLNLIRLGFVILVKLSGIFIKCSLTLNALNN